MALLKRIADLVRSNVNDMLDKAEDPKKILDQTILDMQGEYKSAKKRLVETLTLLKQGEKQAEKYKKDAADWEQKAMAALKAGNEDLARQALGEKQKIEELAQEAAKSAAQQKTFTDELKSQLGGLEQKIEEAKKKRDELVARLKAAEMKKKQADMRAGGTPADALNNSSAFDTFNRMVDKIEGQEAEVEARVELMDKGPAVEAAIDKELEAQSADEALEALKAKMAQGGDAPPPADTPKADDGGGANPIEDELEALRKKLDGG